MGARGDRSAVHHRDVAAWIYRQTSREGYRRARTVTAAGVPLLFSRPSLVDDKFLEGSGKRSAEIYGRLCVYTHTHTHTRSYNNV